METVTALLILDIFTVV